MAAPPSRTPLPAPPAWIAPVALVAAVALVYANSLSGPFVFDDLPAIRDNPSLDSFASALRPPSAEGNTVGGRPLLNLTFALNRALGGLDVRGYHAFNLLIHAAAALALHAAILRILAIRAWPHARLAAFASALLWAVHPLGTAAVTYVVQRAESLAALATLACVCCFFRGADGRRAWLAASALAALLGVAVKETAAGAALLVLLLDRTLVAGSFRAALRLRPAYYTALAASWLALAALVASADGRGGSVGFGHAIDAFRYLATQCRAILHYLQLAFWPDPLVFDHGSPVVRWPAAAPAALALAGALGATAWALRRRSLAGLAGAAFFLLLAPSSSILPITTQTIAEHRMYLPLAAVTALVTGTAARWGGRPVLLGLLALSVPLGWATHLRNRDYRSAESLWADTVAKRPDNPRAHNNLGTLLAEAGRDAEAIGHFEAAIRLVPDNPGARNNLGNVLRRLGRPAESLPHYERALQLEPENVPARVNYATALYQAGRPAEAAVAYADAARQGPLDAEAQVNHGAALLAARRPAEAAVVLEAAIVSGVRSPRLRYNLGNARAGVGDWPAAIAQYREALALEPNHLPAQANLGNALLASGRPEEAIAAYEAALRLRPGDARLQASLARARALAGRP